MVLTERNNSPAASLLDLPAATRSATARSCGVRSVIPFSVRELYHSLGADTYVERCERELRAFPGPAESLAVGKIDSGSVVGERQRLDAE